MPPGEECVESLEEQIKYLGKPQMLFLINQVRFNPDKFGKNKIQRQSVLINQQFENDRPSWLSNTVQF